VFAGGFTLEALDAVRPGAESELDPLDGVSSLVGKSLVSVTMLDEATPWYSMLQTIREFVLEKLDEAGEGEAARRRHAEFSSRHHHTARRAAAAGPIGARQMDGTE
jgi:predicted ATPase